MRSSNFSVNLFLGGSDSTGVSSLLLQPRHYVGGSSSTVVLLGFSVNEPFQGGVSLDSELSSNFLLFCSVKLAGKYVEQEMLKHLIFRIIIHKSQLSTNLSMINECDFLLNLVNTWENTFQLWKTRAYIAM